MALDREAILGALGKVKDPEIPVVSVIELGIVQDVRIVHDAAGDEVEVDITPTFSGCPALEQMQDDIVRALRAAGASRVTVKVILSPPWTSDRISPVARERMRSIGLEPPPLGAARHFTAPRFSTEIALTPAAEPTPGAEGRAVASSSQGASTLELARRIGDVNSEVACPYCGSTNTRLESAFGATLCRTLNFCNTCRQGFEAFKAL